MNSFHGELGNPFTVISPEKMDANTAKQLFVEVFSDFPQVKNPGHALILGARGSGKSMMFRCLLPDVLMLMKECDFARLKFLSFHITVKNTQLDLTDLEMIETHHAGHLINEHFFALSILIEITGALVRMAEKELFRLGREEYKRFFSDSYAQSFICCGGQKLPKTSYRTAKDFFKTIYKHLLSLHGDFISFVREISFGKRLTIPDFKQPLFSYLGFIVPFCRGLKELPGFPKCNVYLFIDDADNLSLLQTQVLNSWLATRTHPEICLKVSAQKKRFKSYLSINGISVESPHDYQEVDISDRYTTSKRKYFERVYEIAEKRLQLAGVKETNPEKYFPIYPKQEEEIEKEKERLNVMWGKTQKGFRAGDDAYRYARPNFIRSLGGKRKASSKYMYAGFEQLVHLSSGIVRLFLDSAAMMFDETIRNAGENQATFGIPYQVQDEMARKQAESMMFAQFMRLETDEKKSSSDFGVVQRLRNLVYSLGVTFHEILISDRSERRVFSIALSNYPTDEIKEVLEFGVQTGYLHEATIGTKDGTGKTWLYILNRHLAPQFTLDPTGFSGYLFVTNEALLEAMRTGKKLRDLNDDVNPAQLLLFP